MLKMELTKNVFFLIFLCGFYGFGEDMGIIRGPMYSSGAHALSPYNTYIYISLSLSLYIYWLKFSKADEGNPHICEAQREPPFTHNASPHHTIMTA